MPDNILSALQPTLFAAARVVPRELTGFLAIAGRDFSDQGVNKGGSVKVSNIPAITATATDAPAQTFTEGTARTIGTNDFQLNQTAQAKWKWSAEDERLLLLGGTAADTQIQTFQQGFRAITNQMEQYVGVIAKNNASRAVGVAGSAPFGTNTNLLVDAQIALKINGSTAKRAAVLSLMASANLQKLTQQQKVNEAGSSALLREGQIGRLHSFDLLESGAMISHSKGTGTSYTSTAAGFPIGTTSIPLITGSGTVVTGDCVTFAGDTNSYKVKTGIAAPGTLMLQEPGLLQALPASAVALAIGGNYASNICLDENALKLVCRPALQPAGGIAEQMIISDVQTKLSVLVLRVVGDGQSSWYMRTVYDAFCPNPYGIIDLVG